MGQVVRHTLSSGAPTEEHRLDNLEYQQCEPVGCSRPAWSSGNEDGVCVELQARARLYDIDPTARDGLRQHATNEQARTAPHTYKTDTTFLSTHALQCSLSHASTPTVPWPTIRATSSSNIIARVIVFEFGHGEYNVNVIIARPKVMTCTHQS